MISALNTKSIYTTHEISRLLHVNPRSVINWIEQDRLSSYRTPGGHRRIRREDLVAFLRKHQIPTPAELADGTYSIFIVEDEEEIVDLIRNFLSRQGGYDISSASNGISALIEIGRSKPDLIILDIRIPGVDGLEVCRRIKADPTNTAAIVAISGQAEVEQKILQTGADAFLAKPLNLDRLLAESKRLLRLA
jgi:excisionase family DNA binding protein